MNNQWDEKNNRREARKCALLVKKKRELCNRHSPIALATPVRADGNQKRLGSEGRENGKPTRESYTTRRREDVVKHTG